jgi:hypothetical protein
MGDVGVYAIAAQSAAVVVSAISVVSIIVWNRIITRRRATLDMLLSEQTDEFLLRMRSEFIDVERQGNLISFAEKEKWGTSQSSFLFSILNRLDLTAVGVAEGIIDRRILHRYWRASFVRDWIRCKDCVELRRQIRNDPDLYSDFERLARSWATADELKKF